MMHAVCIVPHDLEIRRGGFHRGQPAHGFITVTVSVRIGIQRHAPDSLYRLILHKRFHTVHILSLIHIFCLPKRQLDNIVETLAALDKIAPGTMNYDTLLYGVECKYYSARPDCTDFELDGCEKIYAVGDGTGFTRSLSQAAAHGLYVADKILRD